jgi:integrase
MNKLTDLAVRKAKAPGLYGDGAGLYLMVDARGGTKRWVYVFQWQKKRAEMGLGALADVSLAKARDERDAARKLVKAGQNPIEVRKAERASAEAAALEKVQTFGEWAEEVAPAIGPKAKKARKAWISMMQVKVGALAQMAPADIQTEHVLAALKPYWLSRPESGDRMRQRVEKVLEAAQSKELITDPAWRNPARLKGHLDRLLDRRPKIVKHRKALPYAEAPAFMTELRRLDRMAAAALEWVILSAVRNIEGRGARPREIDFKTRIWTIPAERMKGPEEHRRPHRVYITDPMLALLERVKPPAGWNPDAFVFPCPDSRGGMFSENALQNVVTDMGFKGRATVHGFRSTFKDWATECTNFPDLVSEAALAHLVGDDTQRAYRRTDVFLRRQKLMEAWAGYLARPPAAGNVRPRPA